MTTQEFHIGVNLGVQKIGSNVNDNFLPQEIDYFLNESIKDYVKEQYTLIKNSNKNQQSELINENLRTLIQSVYLANVFINANIPHAIDADLPASYSYFLFARTKFSNEWHNNRYIQPTAIKNFVQTYSNSPIFREFPILIGENKVTVIGDALHELNGTSEVYFTYVRTPGKLNFTLAPNDSYTDLPEHTHKEIVNMTVNKILNIIQPERQSQ